MVASMAVMAREAWTDERLDDLKENVNQRFDEVDKRFDRMESGMNDRFDKVDKRFVSIEKNFDLIHQRFDSMQRTMIICFSSTTVSVVGAVLVSKL